ncbi:DUF2637 domain-containing protein, partial [Streptomyces sp. NPDC006530]|uniref:DUF2637 domain-containing protein n=1 Tax=Streptomyces sp. NPDC006530 TaxID=3364750 RepID=UPI0036C7E411
MTTTLEPDVHVPDARSAAPSRTQAAPSPTFADASDDIDKTSRQASTALMWTCLVLAPFIAFVGFYLSFHNLTAAAHDRFGFPTIGQARLFALGVDGAIVLFLAGDLFFVSRGRHAYPVLRPAAHLMTVGTIWFNATAMGPITEHWDKAIPHAFMPVLFVVTIEAGRHYLIQAAELEMGLGRQSAPFARWILAPRVTFAMWSRMKQWGYTYEEVMDLEQERAIYGVWLEHREELEAGHEEGMVSALDRLPITMKKFGMSVDDALALPDKMRRQAQERDQRATAAEIHLSLAAEKAAADAEAQRLQIQGEIDRVRASVAAETGIAEARAEASTAGARLEATSAVAAAKRAAEAADRQAEIEAAAEQSAKVAEESAKEQAALAKAAQESAKIAEAKRQEAEAKRITAEESAKEQAALAKVAEESAKIARAEQQTAEA